jgi:hypothetical protein
MQDIQVYVDGQIESINIFNDVLVDTVVGPDVRFGMRAGNTWTPFNGLLDEVRIDSIAMTPQEVAALAGIIQ